MSAQLHSHALDQAMANIKLGGKAKSKGKEKVREDRDEKRRGSSIDVRDHADRGARGSMDRRDSRGIEGAAASVEDDWLRGKFEAKRTIMTIYNPNPTGGITELAERLSGYAPGVGVYDLEMMSPVVRRSHIY
jgi:hypothetical protein